MTSAEAHPLFPELVIHHDRFVATWPVNGHHIAIYDKPADWFAGNPPAAEFEVPGGSEHTAARFAELVGGWITTHHPDAVPARRRYGIEIAGYRDPDGDITIEVFHDGKRVKDVREQIVDPGRGSPYALTEWRQNSLDVGLIGASPAWVRAVRGFYDDAEEVYTVDDLAATKADYTELAPLGPTDNGDAGGAAQMSTAYGRRFSRPLPGGRFAVLDVECYVLNANTDPDVPARPVLWRTFGFTVCTDPANPLGTELRSETHDDPEIPYAWTTESAADKAAFELCQGFDVLTADLRWTYVITGETAA